MVGDDGLEALIFALRLASLMYQSRGDIVAPSFSCKANGTGYVLSVPRVWLDEHPLTEAALDSEAEEWRSLGIRFEVRAVGDERAQALA